MNESNEIDLTTELPQIVCGGEPLLKFLSSFNIPPYKLGFYFFIIISFTLSITGAFCEPKPDQSKFVNYFENISWSISILFIFPIVIGLTKKYYIKIQLLLNDLTKKPAKGRKEQAVKLNRRINSLFNNFYSPIIFLSITVFLNIEYCIQILNKEPYSNWITNGEFLKDFLNTSSGFTYPGFYSAIVQVFLIYWVFNLIWNSFVFAWGLHQIFNKNNFILRVRPLHSDNCCGFSEIGNTSMIFNYIIFLLGIYVSLKVVDKIVIQSLPLTNDIGNPIFLVCYAILAPIFFFLPLSSAHNKMKEAKNNLITPLKNQYASLVESINEHNDKAEIANNIYNLIGNLEASITVWPFNFRSIESFVGTIVAPILPIALPFLVKGFTIFIKYILNT